MLCAALHLIIDNWGKMYLYRGKNYFFTIIEHILKLLYSQNIFKNKNNYNTEIS